MNNIICVQKLKKLLMKMNSAIKKGTVLKPKFFFYFFKWKCVDATQSLKQYSDDASKIAKRKN